MAENWPFCAPPIWNRKYCKYSARAANFSAECNFPTPDWGNVGPVLNYKDENKSGIEFEDKIVTNASPSFFQIKDTSAKCPISRASLCAIPINILKTDLQNKTVSLQTQLKYAGDNEDNPLWLNGFNGRLDALEIQGENFIVHPEWRASRQWIVVSNIKSERSNTLHLTPGEMEENIFFKKTEDIFANDSICQITTKSVGGIGFALLRSAKDVSLVNLNGGGDYESTSLNSGCWTVCSSLSSEVSGLWSVVFEDGTVEVHPAEGPQIWGTKLQTDPHIGQLRWYGCEFGHHPMSLLIAGRSNLFLADLRTAGSRSDNLATAQRNIFKTENMASFIDPDEQICTFKKCEKNPYVYAVLSKTVLMFDIRHCKVPCMKWQHMMTSREPNYASTINMDGKDECLILGSKDQQSVCLLPGMWEQPDNEFRYCAVGLPHHVNLIRDTAELMHRRGVLFSVAADTRLRTSMIGMVPVNLTNGKEFFLIILNSAGDLISQKFVYNRKEEFREVPQSAIEVWKSWEKAISLPCSSVTSDGIGNNQNKDYVLLDATSFLNYSETLVKKKEKDDNLADDIFDDLPINYDLNDLFVEKDYEGLPPVASSWNIIEKINDAKERIPKREKKGTHSGHVGNVSMNTILIKNYKCESEYSRDGIRRVKKKHKIDNVDMTNILRNLPQSVVNSLSNEHLNEYKDALSLSVLSRWKSSTSNQKDVAKKEIFYGRAPFDPDKLTCLPRCLHIEETEQNTLNSTVNDSLLNSNNETSRISQSPSQKFYTASETSSQTPSKTNSSIVPDTSTNPLTKAPIRRTYDVMKYIPKKKRKKIVEGF